LDDRRDSPGVADVGERVGVEDDEVGAPAASMVPSVPRLPR
jgi:hypothetical protein